MDIRKKLMDLTNNRSYLEKLQSQAFSKQAEQYYIETFETKIFEAAKVSENSNECCFDATENDLKYFECLREICGRSKIFIYMTEDETQIVVRWNNK